MMFMMKYMVDPEEMKKMQAQMADEGVEGPMDMFKNALKAEPAKNDAIKKATQRSSAKKATAID